MIRTVFLTLILFNFAGNCAAQSFNCAKAATPTEKLICTDPELGDLDSNLAAKLKRAIHATPAERNTLLADERQWVATRDSECSGAIKTSDDQALLCLKKSYRSRIEALQGKILRETADTALCQRFVDLYRASVAKYPDAPMRKGDNGFRLNQLEFLVQSDAGADKISVTRPTEITSEKKELQDWAARQRPPVNIPSYLAESTTEIPNRQMEIDHLPGTNFYAAHVIAGTAYCYHSHYFTVSNGRAHGTENPTDWVNEDGAGCGAERYFGIVDRTPAAFEIDQRPFGPALGVSISIMGWQGDHFAPSCTAELNFAPHFDANGPLTHSPGEENECVGPDCEDLKKQALALVEDVQKSPVEAERSARDRLTPQQTAEFISLRNPAESEQKDLESSTRPEHLLDTAPLALPLIHQARVYRVQIGHTTTGWRYWKDWTVQIEGKDRKAVFYIGMDNGRLLDATVK